MSSRYYRTFTENGVRFSWTRKLAEILRQGRDFVCQEYVGEVRLRASDVLDVEWTNVTAEGFDLLPGTYQRLKTRAILKIRIADELAEGKKASALKAKLAKLESFSPEFDE